jgi:putative glutamine amidotransferase
MHSERHLIAVSQRVVEIPGRHEVRDCLDQEWSVWLESIVFTCVPVPNRLESAAVFLERIQPLGVILSGGNNIASPVYEGLSSAEPVRDAYECRDRTERQMIEFAQREKLPVLGCCRGMQFLQTFFGGRLSPLPDSVHVARNHEIEVMGERFRQMAGGTELTVNSFHDYGFRREALAAPLSAFAVTRADGTVEGFFHVERPILGVMWHPERRNPAAEFDRALVRQLFSRESYPN